MPLKPVETLLQISDYRQRHAALIALMRLDTTPLLQVLYAGYRLQSQGCYEIYQGMKVYYESYLREQAESAWDDHCRFEEIAQFIKTESAALAGLDEASLMRRMGGRVHPFMDWAVFNALPPGPLGPALRQELTEKIVNYEFVE